MPDHRAQDGDAVVAVHTARTDPIQYTLEVDATDHQRDQLTLAIEAGLSGSVPLLKQARRRRVFRAAIDDLPALVVKAFPLDVPARFRYRKYAFNEAANYREAARREIAVPTYYGYFERRRYGLVSLTGLVIEALDGWLSLAELLHGGAADNARGPVVRLLAAMFERGVNHVDTTPDNFFLSPDMKTAKLIDWQYASFQPGRKIEQLVLQLARLLEHARIDADADGGRRWIADAYDACRPAMPAEEFARLVTLAQRRRQPIGDRLRLKVR